MSPPKSISLIITTYNWPEALELVLVSIKKQSILPNEVIIADDGSGQETADLIKQQQKKFPVPLIHSWQDDLGFRASRSRNLAIAKSKSEYIIMIDGDMILHKHFIRDHKKSANRGYFIQGRRVILMKELTEKLLSDGLTYPISIVSPFVKNKLNAISCYILSRIFTPLLSRKDASSVRSCNLACWYDDISQINGYNEDFIGWGREDSEFVVRLLNSGIKRQDLRFAGVAYHINHTANSRHNLATNDLILSYTIKNKIKYCQNGMNQHIKPHKS